MEFQKDARELRKVYCESLIEAAKKDDRICIVEADLMGANGTKGFAAAFPERTFDVGIAESNMICVAAGLAASGKLPFANSFTPFATRRCFDQVAISVCYTGLNVRICGTDPGISAQLNGGTHMSLEDMAIMRTLPGLTIYEPVDETQLVAAFPQILAHEGPMYIRLFRSNCENVFGNVENYEFKLGKADVLKDGADVAIFCSGLMVTRSLQAADALAAKGISAAVINVHTLKPLDEECVLKYAEKCGSVVTAENHSVVGALGSAVAEVLAEKCPAVLRRIGVKDIFGEVGKLGYLEKRFGMTCDDIAAAAEDAIAAKK